MAAASARGLPSEPPARFEAIAGQGILAQVGESVAEWARLTPMLIAALEGQRFDEATRLQSADFQPLADEIFAGWML